uniref:Sigma 54 modulation/S30EA ribosomal protein C-terminal domain-containing protein n=1 Tax=Chrysotila carterae TaxID=13221 RepID=A0A7S4BHE5_CHRCT
MFPLAAARKQGMRVAVFFGCITIAHALAPGLSLKTGNDLTLTPALSKYANDKVGKYLERYDDVLQSASLQMKVEHRGHDREHQGLDAHIAEITATCVDKQVIRVEQSSDDMYASLDKLSDRLGRVLRKYKDRKNSKRSAVRTSAISEAMDDVDDENDDENDAAIDIATDAASASSSVPLPETPWTLVRKKTFPMPPISVEEALLCLEYIDHDFYVFRNKESNEINVVYKREGSGVGLIEPEQ